MMGSFGVVLGVVGLAIGGACLIWMGFNGARRVSLKQPAWLLLLALLLCVAGYLLTPTGRANLQLLVDRFR